MKTYSLDINLFEKQYQIKTEIGIFDFVPENVWNLIVTSGQILVCDPTEIEFDDEPMRINIKSGEHPIVIVFAEYSNILNETFKTVAAAIIRISNEKVALWKPFLEVDGTVQGYIVESGCACFIDYEATSILGEQVYAWTFEEEPEKYQQLGKLINDTLEQEWSVVELNPKTKANVVAFSSGFGDGVYPVFLGYTENNEIACVLTDFLGVIRSDQ